MLSEVWTIRLQVIRPMKWILNERSTSKWTLREREHVSSRRPGAFTVQGSQIFLVSEHTVTFIAIIIIPCIIIITIIIMSTMFTLTFTCAHSKCNLELFTFYFFCFPYFLSFFYLVFIFILISSKWLMILITHQTPIMLLLKHLKKWNASIIYTLIQIL